MLKNPVAAGYSNNALVRLTRTWVLKKCLGMGGPSCLMGFLKPLKTGSLQKEFKINCTGSNYWNCLKRLCVRQRPNPNLPPLSLGFWHPLGAQKQRFVSFVFIIFLSNNFPPGLYFHYFHIHLKLLPSS